MLMFYPKVSQFGIRWPARPSLVPPFDRLATVLFELI